MSDILFHLPTVVLLAAIVVALVSLWGAVLALRAKQRLRTAISDRPSLTDSVTELRAKKRLTEDDVDTARHIIEEATESLSENDKRRVQIGLWQPSRLGEKRYIADVVTGRYPGVLPRSAITGCFQKQKNLSSRDGVSSPSEGNERAEAGRRTPSVRA